VAGRRLATSRRASRNRSGVAAESSDICRARRDSPGSRSASGARYADAADAQTPRSSRRPLTKRLADQTVHAGGSRDRRAHRAALVVMSSSAVRGKSHIPSAPDRALNGVTRARPVPPVTGAFDGSEMLRSAVPDLALKHAQSSDVADAGPLEPPWWILKQAAAPVGVILAVFGGPSVTAWVGPATLRPSSRRS
jgi:hypothetical protein